MKNDLLRNRFGLTQEMMANWLGIPRASLALAERGHQELPFGTGVQDARLALAEMGLVYDGAGGTFPAAPPLPPPPPEPEPLQTRLRYCRYHSERLSNELELMRRKATMYEARLKALPALRGWAGPVKNAEHEARWLDTFAYEANYQLRDVCGATPQRLLEVRIAGLTREAELLEETLAALPPGPAA